ncbi:MAG: SsrA-binding protein SmpB [Chitinophagales bacterium]|nr:SsrA-binding protein SmpB [Sphingobacteriales bacterium]
MNKEIKGQIRIANKKAGFLYNLVKKYSAGIILQGTEVKAIRMGRVSINEAFCYFKKSELFIKNMNVGEYDFGTYLNHLPNRERKLLLKKSEINQLLQKVKEKGLTIVPVELSINERGFIKIEVSLAQGKKVFDKRDAIKNKDNKREMDRMKKKLNIR